MSYLSIPYEGTTPDVSPDAFVAPDATLIGDVTVGAGTSIWFKCVLRGDSQPITIGRNCNIQDGTVVHIGGNNRPTFIGDNVSVGHMALIHGCTVESGGFVGMKGIVMDGAVIEGGGMLATGGLLTPEKRIKSGEIWAGSPAKYWRDVGPKDLELFAYTIGTYQDLAAKHKRACAMAGLVADARFQAAGSD